ncbi:group II intron reverse transcriptase/maturase [Nostoc sphaeroides CHAB 2801]|uniref:group II intron reverse transcriptase/maturase n=1 Tax=Nostoc sphaeroides TaxID=446679 RepID=UPI001C6FE9DF|nr:group II intron reverse transcriptase/maturase [Nostoc sphaeroides]MCC5627657.1 group II intron reverse transcriptase/maturase [Nostoc sphaeroides CHAB 2801]MCC5633091.1 group II intron reverse transcriptase/maturase [Nostoc sphaeroides CHAB 2801]
MSRSVGKLEVTVAMNKPNSDSEMNIEGWKTINWQQAERYVFKLQKRIYAASRRGDVKQCRKLQHTLMRSWSNRVLAVRRVTVENQGKKTAGVDGVKSLPPKARFELAGQLKLTGKSKPTRRVWIPKPGRDEKRPLGIPVIYDRALQAVAKAALEPEWEAVFEPNSYGFRPGRSCHDAIKQIKLCIQNKAKFVLDADIAKCFDRINHEALLQKLNIKGKVRQQIKAWLKSGVIDKGAFTATSEGTPQGGVISPLLANIALHGMEERIKQYAETLPTRKGHGKRDNLASLNLIRYADDFVVLHENITVVQRCREIISEWLKDIGLQLKPEKTRLTHTLLPDFSEDGKAGFDFLGHHIQQYPAGKYRSNRNGHGKILGFNTLITPTKKASKAHSEEVGRIIKKHRSSPQVAVITDLNPVIRGWTSYYSKSDAKNVGELAKQDYLTYLKLRRWAKRRCGNINDGHIKYWTSIGGNNWVFATREGTANPLRLLNHNEFACSSTDYVKVKSDKSPYDGDTVYWSKRLGIHPQMPNRKAKLLKLQKGKCPWCGLSFQEWDVLEVDHKIPRALRGKDEYKNLQLLHRHCHDEKTALDLIEIRKKDHSKFREKLSQFWNKTNWEWIHDIPNFIGHAVRKSDMTNGQHTE